MIFIFCIFFELYSRMDSKQLRIESYLQSNYTKDSSWLNLVNCPGQWILILSARNWENLNNLKIENCSINDNDQIKKFVEFNWNNLIYLSLKYNCINSNGIKSMRDCKFSKLKTLILQNNMIQNKGAIYLSQCFFPEITNIDLSNNKIGYQGFKHLMKTKWIKLNLIVLQQYGASKQNTSQLNFIQQLQYGQLLKIQSNQRNPIKWYHCLLIQKCQIGAQRLYRLTPYFFDEIRTIFQRKEIIKEQQRIVIRQ